MDAIDVNGLNKLKRFFTRPQFGHISWWKYTDGPKAITSPPIFVRCIDHGEFVTGSKKYQKIKQFEENRKKQQFEKAN